VSKKVLLPLAGMPNQRDMDALQSLIEGKDQRFRSVYIIPIDNPLIGSRKVYVEKRPGFEQAAIGDCLGIVSEGCRPTAIHFSRATGKYITAFCGTDVFVDCTSAGTTDEDETPRGDGRIVAVSDSGGVYYSDDDGESWTAGTAVSASAWSGVAWNGSVWCATANASVSSSHGRRGMTSSDGETWTSTTLPALVNVNASWHHIEWVPSKNWFVAIHGFGGGGESYLAFSDDNGATWDLSARVDAGLSTSLNAYDAAYSPTLDRWVVIGPGPAGGTFNRIRYSDDDGATWAGFNLTASEWRAVHWSSRLELFVACGANGANAYSSDGASWTTAGDMAGERLAESDSLVFAGASGHAYTTVDGSTWVDNTLVGHVGLDVTFNGSVYAMCSYGSNKSFANSSDASSWTIHANAQPVTNFNAIAARWI
jgi:hypothetical protein